MRRKRMVEHTHISETDFQKGKQEGERHDFTDPYHKWRDGQGRGAQEPASANADVLEDTPANRLWGNRPVPELAQTIISMFMDQTGEFPVLSKRENQVLRLYTMGMSEGVVAKELHITKAAVQTYLDRISVKFRGLLSALPKETL